MGKVRGARFGEQAFARADGDGRTPARLRLRPPQLLLSVLAVSLAIFLGNFPQSAQAKWTETQFDQWEWTSGAPDLVGVAVRPDGYLVVASGDAYGGDGFLHLIPPWGAPISAANRFGPSGLHPFHLAIRLGRVYVTRYDQLSTSDTDTHITVLDASTGNVVKMIPWYGAGKTMGITVDPQGNHPLIVEGHPGNQSSTAIYQLDPDSGIATQWMASPTSGLDGNLGFSWDGSTLFYTSNETSGGANGTVYALDRTGRVQYAVHSPSASTSIGAAVLRHPSSDCFGANLYYTSGGVSVTDGTALYQVPPPYAANSFAVVAQKPNPSATGESSDMTLDTSGHLVVSLLSDVVVLSCPNTFVPPTPPPPPTAGLPSPAAPQVPNATGGQAAPLGPPSGPAPPAAAPAGPPPAAVQAAPAAQPQAASAAQQAHQAANQASVEASTQGAVAPNAVGLVDVVDDSPAMSFSASLTSRGGQGVLIAFLLAVGGLTLAAGLAVRRGGRDSAWRVARVRSYD